MLVEDTITIPAKEDGFNGECDERVGLGLDSEGGRLDEGSIG
jgi:hypothetical protein